MRNSDLLSAFVDGATSGSGSNLKIVGNELVNYTTTIAKRLRNGFFWVSDVKYSQTTSRHQNELNRLIPNYMRTSSPIGAEFYNREEETRFEVKVLNGEHPEYQFFRVAFDSMTSRFWFDNYGISMELPIIQGFTVYEHLACMKEELIERLFHKGYSLAA